MVIGGEWAQKDPRRANAPQLGGVMRKDQYMSRLTQFTSTISAIALDNTTLSILSVHRAKENPYHLQVQGTAQTNNQDMQNAVATAPLTSAVISQTTYGCAERVLSHGAAPL